jgi:hypothetical protein
MGYTVVCENYLWAIEADVQGQEHGRLNTSSIDDCLFYIPNLAIDLLPSQRLTLRRHSSM